MDTDPFEQLTQQLEIADDGFTRRVMGRVGHMRRRRALLLAGATLGGIMLSTPGIVWGVSRLGAVLAAVDITGLGVSLHAAALPLVVVAAAALWFVATLLDAE